MKVCRKPIGTKKEERERGQPVTDSQNERRDSVENDEIYVVMVVVDPGM